MFVHALLFVIAVDQTDLGLSDTLILSWHLSREKCGILAMLIPDLSAFLLFYFFADRSAISRGGDGGEVAIFRPSIMERIFTSATMRHQG
jgi:hypothetical protein